MKWYSAKKISELIGITEKGVRKRALSGNWRYKENRGRKEYDFDTLPEDIKIKILESNKSLLCVNEKKDLKKINKNNIKNGEIRAYIIAIFNKDYKLSVDEFCFLYNNNKLNIPSKVKEVYELLSPATFYRWLNKSSEGDITDLSTNYQGKKGFGTGVLNEEQIAILTGIYLKFKSFKMAKTYRFFKEHYGELDASYTTIVRVLKSIPPAVRDLYKKGRKYFNDKYNPYIEMDYSQYKVMQYWDSDHHLFDCFVIDETNRIYRPWLTIFQDMRSRKIVGYNIGSNASSWTIALAFKSALIKYGSPEILKIDNGKDYKGKMLQGYTVKIDDEQEIRIKGLFKKFGVECIFATPYHGQAKPLESFFKTMIEDFTVELPTYLGSNTVSTIKERNLTWKEVKSKVTLTLDELKERFDKWVTKWNASWEHSGDSMNGSSPDSVFNEGIKRYIKLDIPEEYLNYMFARDYIVTVGRNGVTIDKTKYYDPKLIEYKRKKVIARRDIFDIGKIAVYNLDGEYLCEAFNDNFKDLGIAEENIKNVKRAKKEEKEIIKSYEERILLGENITFEEKVIIDASKNKKRKKSEPLVRENKERKSLFI